MPPALPLAAVVLPPREGFGPGQAGALAMIARRLALTPGFDTIVLGGPQAGPTFPGIVFEPVTPGLWPPGNTNIRYAAAVAARLPRRQPAVIEVHNRPEIALALATRCPDVPVCLLFNNDPQDMRAARTPRQRTALLSRLALVMTASAWLRDRLMDGVGNVPRAPAVLPNCLDLAELPPPQPRTDTILFAGRVVENKAPDSFVAACAAALPHLPGWQAQIIGADRFRADSPETAYVAGIRTAAAAANVQMLGYRDHPDVLLAMASAGIVVMPSRWPEPFGLVALEAMASGAPLICSPRGGLPEVAGDAALYADPDDPPALAAAIRALATDPARRAAMSDAGRRRAERFAVGPIRQQLAALRRSVLRRPMPPAPTG